MWIWVRIWVWIWILIDSLCYIEKIEKIEKKYSFKKKKSKFIFFFLLDSYLFISIYIFHIDLHIFTSFLYYINYLLLSNYYKTIIHITLPPPLLVYPQYPQYPEYPLPNSSQPQTPRSLPESAPGPVRILLQWDPQTTTG